jgi:hypothetical protein
MSEEIKTELEELKSKIKSIEEKIENKNERWKPKIDDRFFYVALELEVFTSFWHNTTLDRTLLDSGNCFSEHGEAADYRLALLARNELRKLADYKNGSEWPADDNVYTPAHERRNKKFSPVWSRNTTSVFGFETIEKYNEAIEKIGQENLKLMMRFGLI